MLARQSLFSAAHKKVVAEIAVERWIWMGGTDRMSARFT